MAAKKVYLSGNAKEVVFEDGNSLMNVYVDMADAKEKGFLVTTKSGKTGLAFTIARKPEVGQYGDTHYLYRKDQSAYNSGGAGKPVGKPVGKPATPSKDTSSEAGEDDLPF